MHVTACSAFSGLCGHRCGSPSIGNFLLHVRAARNASSCPLTNRVDLIPMCSAESHLKELVFMFAIRTTKTCLMPYEPQPKRHFAHVVWSYFCVASRTGVILSVPQVLFVASAIVCDCSCFSSANRSWRIVALALLLRSSESWRQVYGVCQSILCSASANNW